MRVAPAARATKRRHQTLGVASAVGAGAAGFILWTGRGEIFLGDEWDFIVDRRGGSLHAWFAPVNEHLLLFPVAVFKALFVTVGAAHFWPYQVAIAVAHLTVVALVFALARRRVGPVLAATAAAPILIFGPGFEVLLFPINLGFAGSLIGGLGMLIAVERRTKRGDVAACGLLTLALVSSSLGICFAFGLLVEIAWRRQPSRFWVALAPVALYAVWYLNYNLHPNRTGPLEPTKAPAFAFHTAAGALSAILGLPLGVETSGHGYHRALELFAYVLLAAAIAAFVRLVLRRRAITERVAMLAATLAAYWSILGVTRAYSRDWYGSRYVYPAAILIVVLMTELARGRTISKQALAVVATIAAGATLLNIGWLYKDGEGRRADSQVLAAELGAVNIARRHIPPDYRIARDDPKRVPRLLTARRYLEAARDIGLPALSARALGRASGQARVAADRLLIRNVVHVRPSRPTPDRSAASPAIRGNARAFAKRKHRCYLIDSPAGRNVTAYLWLPSQGIAVAGTKAHPITVRLRRFSRIYSRPVVAGLRPVGRELVYALPDRSPAPWHAAVSSTGRFTIC